MLPDRRPHGELHARGELRDRVRARGYRDHAADFLDLARFSATDAWTSAVPMMIVALGVIGTLHESNHDTLSPRTIRAHHTPGYGRGCVHQLGPGDAPGLFSSPAGAFSNPASSVGNRPAPYNE